jgi:hypothetical protein
MVECNEEDELESMWKEKITFYLRAESQHFLGGTEENSEKPQSE